MKHPARRGSILVRPARIVAHVPWPGDQHVLTLHAPAVAARARPGSFVHVRCDDALPMRRPLSIQSADRAAGTIELLYKVVGDGTAALSRQPEGAALSVMGPIGTPFTPDPARPRRLLIGGGVGIPPMLFLAEWLHAGDAGADTMVMMGSELPFPFALATDAQARPGIARSCDATLARLDALGIPARLASGRGDEGCWPGLVTELAAAYLDALGGAALRETEIFSCGPTPMLEAVARLARARGIPCQVSLEEYMACAVGGCAGCTVRVATPDGPAMQRVCVDGPVFDAADVFTD